MRFLVFLLLVSACGKEGDNSTGSVKYYLEQAASSTVTNTLILEVDGEFKPNFSITGKGFTAEVADGVSTPFQERTAVTAETFGEVDIELTLYQENGKPFLTDKINWKSSGEVPPKPEPYFSELASADAYVYLVFPNKLLRGKNTTEVWVEGDLAENPQGSYFPIPSDDQVLIKLSDPDGMKTVRVKYRNIFGAHSELVELSIEKKSVGPQDCQALPVATKTATGSIRTRIQATNVGPLFYKVTGDVALEKDYHSFEDSIEEMIELKGAVGTKRITVKVKDEAGNACPDMPLTIQYDRSYVPGKVTVENDLLWTDAGQVFVLPRYDQLEGDDIEMYITGTVVPGSTTEQWIPYAERVPVELTPTAGTRHVIVQFRKEQTTMLEVSTSIFLRPYVLIQGSGPVYQIMPGNILTATSLSINGCLETYANLPYQETYPCTPSSAGSVFTISVTYNLSDGTSLTRSATH